MKRLNVTFRCDLPFDDTSHPVGEEVAEYLSRRFSDAGVPITKIGNYEDFAWSMDTKRNGKKLYLLLGFVGDGDDEWLMQINEYASSFWHIFRRNQALPEREAISLFVDRALQTDENISVIRWHVGDFAEEGYTPSP
ncbi:hypothetical protein K227x_62050 [Rubripirellula lacrimiformis]|uniref:Uncharacterized protein n=1 Tax=Rubripirellula lacrimiformis TaxID=1930273 RepID=A0A517NKV3_9BACT|nr:hypothetical protein [Rubripirellula lacrimiformis]QDT07777.1 hypothetical protein K227x_62050 [Rubripirellula lacrimiformis]